MARILVTGSSTGIGLATALHFARKGHTVFAGARTPDNAPDLQAGIAAGLPVTPVPLDVDSDSSVAAAVASVGDIDVLVNNAGIGGGGPVELTPIAHARQVFETNYFGAVRMIQAVLPGMRRQGRGAIVNVTSVAGRICVPGHSHYAASKWALEALAEGLAAELKPFGIRVANVEPGVVRTPIFQKSTPPPIEQLHPYEKPMQRLWGFFAKRLEEGPVLPEEVASVIDEAAFSPAPRLRWLAGPDAEAIVAGRATVSDEEWIDIMGAEDDDVYRSGMMRLLGGNRAHPLDVS